MAVLENFSFIAQI